MQPFTTLTGRAVALPVENVDTDQIIPARFLKTTGKAGLGAHLFADWRYRSDGTPRPDFSLNRPQAAGAPILLAGGNFGCGSSREHAPWALLDHGFRAIVSSSFGDIFKANALQNGLLPVTVDPPTLHRLFTAAQAFQVVLTIDLATQRLTLPDGSQVPFPIDPFSKTCLLAGVDALGYLLQQTPAIAAYESRHRPPLDTRPQGAQP